MRNKTVLMPSSIEKMPNGNYRARLLDKVTTDVIITEATVIKVAIQISDALSCDGCGNSTPYRRYEENCVGCIRYAKEDRFEEEQ